MIIYYIIIIIIIVFLYIREYENFEIVSYNNNNIPNYKINSTYDNDINELQKIFNSLNIKNKNFQDSILDDQFKLINSNLIFPFTNVFKSIIIEYIYTNIPKYKNDNVYILGKFNKIYQKDQGTSRIFIFNCTLVNPINFITFNIKIRLKINNINLILDEKYNYIDIIDNNFIKLNTILESIIIDNPDLKNTFTPIDNLYEPLYLIKNKYHLLDPFMTSGRESIITKHHKLIFQNILNEKHKRISSEYKSYSDKFTLI